MNVHAISPKRLITYWFAAFATVYVSGLFLYTLYQITSYPVVFIALQAVTPLANLLFAWLYFRGASENDWAARLLVAGAWFVLTMLGMALLMQPVYGYPWTSAFTVGILRGQAINAAAVLVAGWVAKK